MKRSRKKRHQETVELNITAFLNLMVILVPFLLITAVFSRMTILELNLPGLGTSANPDEPIKLQLQLTLTPEDITLSDPKIGEMKRVSVQEKNGHWRTMGKVLVEIKTRFPEEQSILLLVDNRVSYKDMIYAMDRLRSFMDGIIETELFPQISIGNIPLAQTDAEQVSAAAEGEAL